ncbi:MAG: LssY C-terminal domain-containing protein [Phycisphaerales bacterium]
MSIADTLLRLFLIRYEPHPEDPAFMGRAQTRHGNAAEATVAVADVRESERFFGVPMGRRGVQPVWIRIVNRGQSPVRLSLVGVSSSYYTPLEAAAINHYSILKRLAGFGLVAWLFLPLLVLIPFKLVSARRANRRMDAFFQEHAFRLRPIPPGAESSGFVFTPIDDGMKVVHVRLLGAAAPEELTFSVPVPGLDTDHLRRRFDSLVPPEALIECDLPQLRQRLEGQPRATSNARGTREGDPVNLVIVGEFPTLLSAFGARWDETETITLATSWKTMKSFLLGSPYRYSPVSSLYLLGRSQDVALQRIRGTINERLHLRLWATPLRYERQPVWVGQVSRDIGVRFTWRTWNLTTHRVDPDVDEARDYVVEDLLEAGRIDRAGYVGGVGACEPSAPRRNLTGDPFHTDGQRAVIQVSDSRTTPKFVVWAR